MLTATVKPIQADQQPFCMVFNSARAAGGTHQLEWLVGYWMRAILRGPVIWATRCPKSTLGCCRALLVDTNAPEPFSELGLLQLPPARHRASSFDSALRDPACRKYP